MHHVRTACHAEPLTQAESRGLPVVVLAGAVAVRRV